MSIFSTGAKVIGKTLSPAEKAASDFVKGISRIIPSETKSGQTALFMPSDYKPTIPKRTPQGGPGLSGVMSTPPFKGGGRFTGGDPRAAVTGLARREELAMKRKAKKPVKGSITTSVKTPIEGPKTSDVSKVDDLFGVGDAPMGYKYGSRK
jgi:hypothetical protein